MAELDIELKERVIEGALVNAEALMTSALLEYRSGKSDEALGLLDDAIIEIELAEEQIEAATG